MTAVKDEVEAQALELLSTEEGKKLFVDLLVQNLDEKGLSILATRLTNPCGETTADLEFAEKLGIPTYSQDEKRAFELVSMLKFFDYRKSLLANALPNGTVAEMLGVSRQTPHDRVKAGQLLGMLDNNVLKFPEWQFDAEGPNGVVLGLPQVLSALKCGPLAKISWLSTPNPIFDGARPIDALKMGLMDNVIHEASAVGVN
jgi:hypothetical protein